MLDKSAFFTLLEERNQNPRYRKNSNTIIETSSAGTFYVLEYNGSDWVGWTVSDSMLQEIKSYPKHAIVFMNSMEGEMYLVLEGSNDFFDFLDTQIHPYKIGKKDVMKYEISYENLDEYLSSLEAC